MIMFFLVASTRKTYFMWARDVVEHGVGHVKRNTVLNITIRPQGNACLPQKIIMISVVGKNLDSAKKITVLGVTMDIVGNDGKISSQRSKSKLRK